MGAFSMWSFLAQSIQGTGGQKYCLVYLDTFCIAILLFFLLSYHLNLLIQCFFGSQKCRIICFNFDALRIAPYFVLSHLRCRSGRYETCATGTQHPAQYPHIVKLMLHLYVYASLRSVLNKHPLNVLLHIGAGLQATKPLLCKRIVVSSF